MYRQVCKNGNVARGSIYRECDIEEKVCLSCLSYLLLSLSFLTLDRRKKSARDSRYVEEYSSV